MNDTECITAPQHEEILHQKVRKYRQIQTCSINITCYNTFEPPEEIFVVK